MIEIFTTQPELEAPRANWFGSAFTMHRRGQVFEDLDFTPEDVSWNAELANTGTAVFRTEDGGIREKTSVVGQPFVLDFEEWMDVSFRPRIVDYILQFRRLAPDVRLGMYPGGWMYDRSQAFWPNNDMLYRGEDRAISRITKAMEDFRPIADLLDFVSPSVYPLEKEAWKRDQSCIRMIVSWCRRFGKPVYPFVFGGWRDFRGDGVEKVSKMNAVAMSQYGEIIREECEGAIVWGKWPGNANLIKALKR